MSYRSAGNLRRAVEFVICGNSLSEAIAGLPLCGQPDLRPAQTGATLARFFLLAVASTHAAKECGELLEVCSPQLDLSEFASGDICTGGPTAVT